VIPDHVTLELGLVFIKCPDCGLNQGADTAKRKAMPNGAQLLHCIRCNGLLDPDEELTEEFMAKLRVEAAQTKTSKAPENKAPPATKAPEQPAAPTPAKPASTPAKEKPCVVCGKALTETSSGVFPSCGHSQEPAASKSTPKDKHEIPLVDPDAESVTACYGEEKFSPRQYQNFAIGPFFRSTKIRPGETAAQALARASEELRAFADIEFKKKATDFISRLDWLDKEVNGGKGGSR
jgi:hypothetical protein